MSQVTRIFVSVRRAKVWFIAGLSMVLGISSALSDQVTPSSDIGILVSPGSDKDPVDYYKRISPILGVTDLTKDLSDLYALILYLGVYKLDAEKLEYLPPDKLSELYPSDQVISARFFAPKIVDFNFPGPADYPYKVGWRKLVRIEPSSGSPADKAGIGSANILFNYVQADPKLAPFPDNRFTVESFNTQVILVPRTVTKRGEDSAFFLDYSPRSGKYLLTDHLDAAFDTATEPSKTKTSYYVPVACGQCHGHDQEFGAPSPPTSPIATGTFPFAKLNYLDTDQWYDLAGLGEFPTMASGSAKWDVLFDGGTDHSESSYAAALEVFRKLNSFVLTQNVQSARDDGSDEFKVRAVEKWLNIHQSQNDPVAPIDRALDLGGGSMVWQKTSEDVHLLTALDQYCFRCHSSILFNVFDKQAVYERSKSMVRRLNAARTSAFHMPQGRVLDSGIIVDLVKYLQNMP